MLVQSVPETGKYSQTPKDLFSENFRHDETKKFSTKNRDTPTYAQTFWYQKLSETQKGHLTDLLWQTKVLDIFFWNLLYGSPKCFHQTSGQRQKLSRRAPSLIFRYSDTMRQKVSDFFLVIPSYGLPKHSRRSDEQPRLWRVLSLSFFRP